MLFIGSFAHLPNLLALDYFLREVWPGLTKYDPVLHVIAGADHQLFHRRSRDRLAFSLDDPRLELEDFVSDVRPAYARASVVIAPLRASAGTNIKIMEAMAMGKAVVSTSAGINGLHELRPGHDVIIEDDPARMAAAIGELFTNGALRGAVGQNARATAERVYSWDAIAAGQRDLYQRLVSATAISPATATTRATGL